ncbi:GAP family protein [Segnochrobactraceae bacterium EtOH-i3]
MTSVLADAVTHGLGVALSPLVIIVLVMILLSPRSRPNGAAFLVGWLAGLAGLGALIFALGGAGDGAGRPLLDSALNVGFGLLLLGLAARSWMRRHLPHERPRWLTAVDTLTLPKAAAAGCFFAAIYPKNLALTATAASGMASALGSGGAAAYLLFAIIASLTIAGPVLTCLVLGDRITPALTWVQGWLSRHGPAVLILLLAFFGAKLLLRGGVQLAGLAG